ncbi:MAG: DUF4241 domain-containing protein [Polyangiales bacterium]
MRPKLRLVGAPARPGRRRWLWFVGAAIVVVSLAVLQKLARTRRGGSQAAQPLEEHGGRCATPAPAGTVVPCPYLGMQGPNDFGAPFAGEPEGTCRLVGHLVMRSGELVAADPLVFLNDRAFTITVPPGTYPVFLAQPKKLSGDVALSLLRIRESRPVRWEIAKLPGEEPGAHFYPVDAGTGCYVDRLTARTILAREKGEIDRQVAVVQQSGVDPSDGNAWHAAMERAAKERKNLLELLNAAGYEHGPSASLCIDAESGGDIVAFAAAPEMVPASGAVAAFVTDFKLLDSEP